MNTCVVGCIMLQVFVLRRWYVVCTYSMICNTIYIPTCSYVADMKLLCIPTDKLIPTTVSYQTQIFCAIGDLGYSCTTWHLS